MNPKKRKSHGLKMPRSTFSAPSRSSKPSFSTSSSAFKPVTPKPTPPAPVPYHPPSSPITFQQQAPTLGQSMKEGFGLGVGLSVARNVVDGLFGSNRPAAPPPVQQSQQLPSPSPITHPNVKEFQACMERTYNNYDECKTHLPPQ